MDLLATLGLGSSLPEQTTQLTSHPGITQALDGGGGGGGEGVRLGFDACLRCGTGLPSDDDGEGDGGDGDGDATPTAAFAHPWR